MAADQSNNMALLIDGDNVSPRVVSGLMAEVVNYGTASVRRIYGDWTQPGLNGWKKSLLSHSILPIQQFAYTTGKNATDGAMIIDAMDLVYTGRFSSFCIASSDSDFTRLAARIREQGVTVYGFGKRKTPPAFIAACNKFVYFDVLSAPATESDEVISAPPVASARSTEIPERLLHTHIPLRGPPSIGRPLDEAALEGSRKAIRSSVGNDGEWANLAAVGQYLVKISPDLNARNYGYDRLKDFVETSGLVGLKMKPMGDNPPIALVSLKPQLHGHHSPRR